MTIHRCDMCHIPALNGLELVTVAYQFTRQAIMGSERGTRVNQDELCWDCYRKVCWAISAVWENRYSPTDPCEEPSLPQELSTVKRK